MARIDNHLATDAVSGVDPQVDPNVRSGEIAGGGGEQETEMP